MSKQYRFPLQKGRWEIGFCAKIIHAHFYRSLEQRRPVLNTYITLACNLQNGFERVCWKMQTVKWGKMINHQQSIFSSPASFQSYLGNFSTLLNSKLLEKQAYWFFLYGVFSSVWKRVKQLFWPWKLHMATIRIPNPKLILFWTQDLLSTPRLITLINVVKFIDDYQAFVKYKKEELK